MPRTIEVEIDAQGVLHFLGPVGQLPAGRALLTLLTPEGDDVVRLADPALAEEGLRPDEDAAWALLAPDALPGDRIAPAHPAA